jgi:putative PIN family toxin of toxin-antitoxin system
VRIVADTNSVVFGLLWQGPPRQIIDAARAGTITLYTSVTLLAELAEVIGRDKFAQRIRRAGLSVVGLVENYQRLAVLVEPQPLPAPVSRDADDDHVLACALAAQVALIVSGDRDLLDLGAFNHMRILPARQALDLIGAAP